MALNTANPAIEEQAKMLALENLKAEPAIKAVYWFPHEEEVRLVEVIDEVPQTMDGVLHPFYFHSSPKDNLAVPSAIAMIRANEFGKLKLPADWGNWNDAMKL